MAGEGQAASTAFRGDPAERMPEEEASLERPVKVLAAQPYRDVRSEPMLRGYDEWKARQVANGQVLPGTPEEAAAVERSDEIRREQMGSRGVAGMRYEGGRWVVWRHPPRRKRKPTSSRVVRYGDTFDVEA